MLPRSDLLGPSFPQLLSTDGYNEHGKKSVPPFPHYSIFRAHASRRRETLFWQTKFATLRARLGPKPRMDSGRAFSSPRANTETDVKTSRGPHTTKTSVSEEVRGTREIYRPPAQTWHIERQGYYVHFIAELPKGARKRRTSPASIFLTRACLTGWRIKIEMI